MTTKTNDEAAWDAANALDEAGMHMESAAKALSNMADSASQIENGSLETVITALGHWAAEARKASDVAAAAVKRQHKDGKLLTAATEVES